MHSNATSNFFGIAGDGGKKLGKVIANLVINFATAQYRFCLGFLRKRTIALCETFCLRLSEVDIRSICSAEKDYTLIHPCATPQNFRRLTIFSQIYLGRKKDFKEVMMENKSRNKITAFPLFDVKMSLVT